MSRTDSCLAATSTACTLDPDGNLRGLHAVRVLVPGTRHSLALQGAETEMGKSWMSTSHRPVSEWHSKLSGLPLMRERMLSEPPAAR